MYVCMLECRCVSECEGSDHGWEDLGITVAEVVGACKASLCYHLVQVMHNKDGHVSASS